MESSGQRSHDRTSLFSSTLFGPPLYFSTVAGPRRVESCPDPTRLRSDLDARTAIPATVARRRSRRLARGTIGAARRGAPSPKGVRAARRTIPRTVRSQDRARIGGARRWRCDVVPVVILGHLSRSQLMCQRRREAGRRGDAGPGRPSNVGAPLSLSQGEGSLRESMSGLPWGICVTRVVWRRWATLPWSRATDRIGRSSGRRTLDLMEEHSADRAGGERSITAIVWRPARQTELAGTGRSSAGEPGRRSHRRRMSIEIAGGRRPFRTPFRNRDATERISAWSGSATR